MPRVNSLEGFQYALGQPQYGFGRNSLVHTTANLVGEIEVGENTRIDGFVLISGRVKIGRNCHVATGACLFGGEAGIEIGDHCGVSAGARIFTGTDDPRSDRLRLHAENELPRDGISGPVQLCDFVTIGANSVLVPRDDRGIFIGPQTMIGALSLVRGACLGNSIYAGVPAKRIGQRQKLNYDQEKK